MDAAKLAIGQRITDNLPREGVIAFGSGTTVNAVIKSVAKRKEEFQEVQFISGSSLTSIRMTELNIPEISIHTARNVDVVVDGADQVSENEVILKGRGGALMREKILWEFSDNIIVGVTHNKLVDKITGPVPIEIEPFALPLVQKILDEYRLTYSLRSHPTGIPFYSDGGNYLIDITDYNDIEVIEKLTQAPGIIETGIFKGYNPRFFIHSKEGVLQR